MMPHSAAAAIRWTTILAAICMAITAAETLAERESYADDRMLGWPVVQSRRRALLIPWFAPVLNALFGSRGLQFLMIGRLLGAVALIAAPGDSSWRTAVILYAAATSLLLAGRTVFGMDGADQLNTLTFLALATDAMVPTPLVRAAALWFLALQLIMAYTVSGGAKLISQEWRSGRAIWGVTSTRMYGFKPLGLWLKARPGLSQLLSWSVFLLECAFAMLFIVPEPVAWILVAGGLVFHASNAVIMGLNTFLWAFLAGYPALIWCRFGR
jgi:hypothetical protein